MLPKIIKGLPNIPNPLNQYSCFDRVQTNLRHRYTRLQCISQRLRMDRQWRSFRGTDRMPFLDMLLWLHRYDRQCLYIRRCRWLGMCFCRIGRIWLLQSVFLFQLHIWYRPTLFLDDSFHMKLLVLPGLNIWWILMNLEFWRINSKWVDAAVFANPEGRGWGWS